MFSCSVKHHLERKSTSHSQACSCDVLITGSHLISLFMKTIVSAQLQTSIDNQLSVMMFPHVPASCLLFCVMGHWLVYIMLPPTHYLYSSCSSCSFSGLFLLTLSFLCVQLISLNCFQYVRLKIVYTTYQLLYLQRLSEQSLEMIHKDVLEVQLSIYTTSFCILNFFQFVLSSFISKKIYSAIVLKPTLA